MNYYRALKKLQSLQDWCTDKPGESFSIPDVIATCSCAMKAIRELMLRASFTEDAKPLTEEQLMKMGGQPIWWWNKSAEPVCTICQTYLRSEPYFVSFDFIEEDTVNITPYRRIRRWGYLPYAKDPTMNKEYIEKHVKTPESK